VKRKRARKSKGKANDDESIVGGKARSAVSGTSGRGRGKRRKSRDESVDEEEEGGEELALEMVARTQEEKQKEVQQRAMLVDLFDNEQFTRYEAWRSCKLPDAVVRRVSSLFILV
jgi:transcription initiation factor TFIID subunit 11